MERRVIDRKPAGDLPPQVAAQRRDRIPIRQALQRLQHDHRGAHIHRHRGTTRHREQIIEQAIREHLATMIGEEREHTALRHQMTAIRLGVQQLPRCRGHSQHAKILLEAA